jgi:uncharacterized protein (TIGR00725 family)
MGSGTDSLAGLAEPLGRLLATLEVNLLTGGGGGVMEAVARAYVAARPRRGISIGILPCVHDDPAATPAGYPNPYVQLAVRTHLPDRGGRGHLPTSRNHLNVLNSDAIVALPGGRGTASELRLALEYGTPAVIHCLDDASVAHYPAEIERVHSLAQVEAFLRERLQVRRRS